MERLPDYMPRLIHCLAEPTETGQWQAFSLEFGLAAQADSYLEVKAKLDSMINCYANEALTVDREHARDLLSRRAVRSVYLRYYVVHVLRAIGHVLRKAHVRVRNPGIGLTFLEDMQGFRPC